MNVIKNNAISIKKVIYITLEPLKQSLQSIKSSDLNYIGEIKKILESYKQNKVTYDLSNTEELESIKSSQKYLTILRENMRDIRNDIKYFLNELNHRYTIIKFYLKLSYQIPKNITSTNIDQLYLEEYDSIIKIKNIESYLFKLSNFKARSIHLTKEIISDANTLFGYIPNVRQKLLNAKSKLNKRKLIEYIINLIDEIKFIMRVEPSEIVKHLKHMNGIKPDLESIKSSIKTKDIETDINNLQKLYSEMIDIESFRTNMSKLKEYIPSVEIHLGGIDTVLNSLKNIQGVINSHPLKLILSESGLEEFYRNKHKSKLKEDDPVKKYMDQIKDHIFILNYLVHMIYQNINKIEPLVNKLKRAVEFIGREMNVLKSDIIGVECAIEGVARNLVLCCIQCLKGHLISQNLKKTVEY